MTPEDLSPDEINVLIADRLGARVYAKNVDGHERFFLRRDDGEVSPADYCRSPDFLPNDRVVGVWPEDSDACELYKRATSGKPTTLERAHAFINAFVSDPEGQLAIIRERSPSAGS